MTFPEADFAGLRLQSLTRQEALEPVFASVVPGNGASGLVSLSWFKNHVAPRLLVDSLIEITEADVPDALLRFIFASFENVPIAPVWWDRLEEPVRDAMIGRFGRSMRLLPVDQMFTDDGVRVAEFVIENRSFVSTD